MPTNTDLVTDLPADFEVFGQAVDSSMADLKGGTTGQILSKASATDMDFTWITNDVGDITAVTATSPLTGGGTSGAITVGIQDATTSVKGSVQLSDSTSTTSSVLAATPTAVKSAYDLAALASPAAAAFYSGKNRQLNSNFSVWQRGTSIVLGAGTYTADRWYGYRAVAGSTVTRQATGDTTNLPFIQYCARVQRDSGNTSTSAIAFATSFESVNSIPLAGKSVTLSFYARAGANFSQASSTLTFLLASGTGTDQNVMFGYTGQATVATTNAVLTTTWQRFTVSGTVAATATEIGLKIGDFTPVGTAGAADYFEITGVQIEVGSTASPYAPNTSTYQAELVACQRYYYRTVPNSFASFGTGVNLSTVLSNMTIPYPVTMRTAPTALEQTGTASDYRLSHTTATTCSAVPLFASASTAQSQVTFTVAAGLLLGGAAIAQSNAANAYLGWSAEL